MNKTIDARVETPKGETGKMAIDATKMSDAELDQWWRDWSDAGNDADACQAIGAIAGEAWYNYQVVGISRQVRQRMHAAYWRVFHCPPGGWVTGP